MEETVEQEGLEVEVVSVLENDVEHKEVVVSKGNLNTPHPPTKHGEGGLTQKQTAFAKAYMNTGNATLAAKEAFPDSEFPAQVGYAMKQKPQIMNYIMSNAHRCAEIQMQIIENEKTPPAVRMDGIKNVLDRAGIGKSEDDDTTSIKIGDIKITIDR